jgi:putative MATE family efflux protein
MAKMPKNYGIEMTEGPLLGKMLAFSLPLMFSSALQLLFSAVNLRVIGRYSGEVSIAAVGSTGSLVALITNVFIGLSVGANVVAAKNYGAHRDAELNRTVHTAMLLSVVSGAILTLVGVAGARLFLFWMNTPEDVIGLAAVYLRVYFLGITASMVYNFGSAVLRAIGDTRRPLYYLLFAGALNVLLNLLFVLKFRMDVAGVALATAISQTVAAVLVVTCLVRSSGALHLDLRRMRIDRAIFVDILKVGLPAGFQGTLFSVSNVLIQSSINVYQSDIMAGNAAASQIESFVYVSMNAFSQAAISFTSQNFGARQMVRIRQILFYTLASVVVVGLVLSNAAYLFGRPLLNIFVKGNPAVIAAGLERLAYVGRLYVLCGMMEVMVGMLRGIGYSVMPMIVSLFGSCVLRILWIYFVAPSFGHISGIYVSYPISWGLTFLAHVGCYLWAIRRVTERDQMEPRPA